MTSVAFQSILRKQIRNLPKILKSVKIINYYSLLFICVLGEDEHGLLQKRALRSALQRKLPKGAFNAEQFEEIWRTLSPSDQSAVYANDITDRVVIGVYTALIWPTYRCDMA